MKSNPFAVAPRAVLLSLCAAVLALLPSIPAYGVQIDGPYTRVYEVGPGDVVEGTLTLSNGRSTPERVRIYVTDYVHDARRGWVFPPAGTLPRSNAPWLRWTDSEFLLQPGEVREVLYQISIPTGEHVRGTYWSSFIIEPQSLQDVLVTGDDGGNGPSPLALRQGLRYQVALITNVGTTGTLEVAFHNPTLERTAQGGYVLGMFLENVGERWLHPHVYVDVYTDTGRRVGHVPAGQPHILPDTARHIVFPLGELPRGRYVGLLVVDEPKGDVFATRFTFEIEQSVEGLPGVSSTGKEGEG